MRRILAVLCIIGATVTGTASAAHAAPPSNDDIENATVVTAAPFYDSTDNSEATSDADDQCGVATVWYAYTPTESGNIRADVSSDFSPVLELRAPGEEPGDRGCSEGGSIFATVTAGETYFISVGTLAPGEPGQVGPGGPFQFQLTQMPLDAGLIEITVDRGATINRDGVVTVSGTITCDRPDSAQIDLYVDQRVGRRTVQGYGAAVTDCGPAASIWTVQLSSDSELSYRPGRARTGVEATNYNTFASFFGELHLRRAP
jgi:hypothetical protein